MSLEHHFFVLVFMPPTDSRTLVIDTPPLRLDKLSEIKISQSGSRVPWGLMNTAQPFKWLTA
jgi:hypothetical protein